MEIILLFLRLHPSTAFRTLLLTMKANPFLLMEVDIIVDIMITILDKMVNSRCSRYNCPMN